MNRLAAPERLSEALGGASAALDARLLNDAEAPIAVAFSGGGDSLALLLIVKAWADGAGRRLLALTVDHGLNPDSGAWTRWCAARAGDLAVEHQSLTWEGAKPAVGVAFAARRARHALIAEAARAAGARVVLFGHTADDVMEAQSMRLTGLSISAPRPWSPSPAWPQGRGLFIARPLLSVRREAIRAALAAAGETWIDDPANLDLAQPRVRARTAIAGAATLALVTPPEPDLSALFRAAAFGPAGDIVLDLAAFAGRGRAQQLAFLAMTIACVGGGAGPARGPFFARLPRLIAEGQPFASTLGGVKLTGDGASLRLAREGGDRRARPAPEIALTPGEATVFDGRFEVTAHVAGLTVRHLAGLAARLAPADRARLGPLGAGARRVLPAIIDGEGRVTCPSLLADARIGLINLIPARLAGACGLIRREAEIGDFDGLVL